MAKSKSNLGKLWTASEVGKLKTMVKQKVLTRVIAQKLGRTPKAIQQKAGKLKVILRPRKKVTPKKKKR